MVQTEPTEQIDAEIGHGVIAVLDRAGLPLTKRQSVRCDTVVRQLLQSRPVVQNFDIALCG